MRPSGLRTASLSVGRGSPNLEAVEAVAAAAAELKIFYFDKGIPDFKPSLGI
jgi:hypothetical protein